MSSDRSLLRLSGWYRLWLVGFATAWTLAMVGLTIRDDSADAPTLTFQGGGVLFVGALVYRAFRQELRLQSDVVVVRNFLGTRRLHRRDIKRIWIGRPVTAPLPGGWTRPFGCAINIEPTRGRPFTIDVSRHELPRAAARDRLRRASEALSDWQASDEH